MRVGIKGLAVLFLLVFAAQAEAREIIRDKYSPLQVRGAIMRPIYKTVCSKRRVCRHGICRWERFNCRTVLARYRIIRYRVNFPSQARLYTGEKEFFSVIDNRFGGPDFYIRDTFHVYSVDKIRLGHNRFEFNLYSRGRIMRLAPMIIGGFSVERFANSNDTLVSFIDPGTVDFKKGRMKIDVYRRKRGSDPLIASFEIPLGRHTVSARMSEYDVMLNDGKYVIEVRIKRDVDVYADSWSQALRYSVKFDDGQAQMQRQQ